MLVNCPSCKQQIEIPRGAAPQVPVPTQLGGVAHSAAEQPPLVQPNPRPERVKYEASTNTFRGTMPQVAKLAMRAIQELGWKIDNVNETLGLVTFETAGMTWGSWSGVSGSLSIEDVGENQFQVSGAGKQNVRGDALFALDLFGEAQGKVSKVLNKMRELAE